MTCVYCGNQRETCANCYSCKFCGCMCRRCICRIKHGPHKYKCLFCGRCRKVCRCGEKNIMAKEVKPVSPAAKTAFVNRLPRSLGLEIELSDWGGLNADSFKPKHCEWYADHDGSVQPSGQEMVVLPLKDDAFPAAVLELYEAFDKFKCQVNDTCGLHVHVGAEDMNGWQVRRLLKLYEMMQGGIYQLCKPGRDRAKSRNGYLFAARLDQTCRQEIQKMWSTTRAGEVRRALIRMIYGVDLNPEEAKQVLTVPGGGIVNGREHIDELAQFIRGMKNKYAGGQGTRGFVSRYFGLNLHSWFLRGTVEWRMKEGTIVI